MPQDGLVLWTQSDRPDLKKAYGAIESASWGGALGYLNFSASFDSDYFGLLQTFADHQLCLGEAGGYPVAVANTLPLPFVSASELPEEGWDWVVRQARAAGEATPVGEAMLGALAISVPALYRGQGLAHRMIREIGSFARRKGYRSVVVAARPYTKALHPWVPIEEYIGWKDRSGRIFDPWLRTHVSVGGRIIGPCRQSVVIDEPIAFWELWAQHRFEHSGEHLLPGCLVPIRIDLESGRGRYVEPSVWVVHDP